MTRYFEEGMKTWAHFGSYVSELSEKLRDVRHRQEEERRHLLATRKIISNSLSAEVKPEVSCLIFSVLIMWSEGKNLLFLMLISTLLIICKISLKRTVSRHP